MLRDPNLHIDGMCDTNEISPTARLGRLFCFSVVLISRELSGSSQTEMLGEAAESQDWELASLIAKYRSREELKDFIFLVVGLIGTSTAGPFPHTALREFGTGFEAELSTFANIKAAAPARCQQGSATNNTHSTFTFRKYFT